MNIVLSLTKTRYLMYVEDDWWVIHDSDKPRTRSGPGNILWRAMEVLKRSSERVSQASEFSRLVFHFENECSETMNPRIIIESMCIICRSSFLPLSILEGRHYPRQNSFDWYHSLNVP